MNKEKFLEHVQAKDPCFLCYEAGTGIKDKTAEIMVANKICTNVNSDIISQFTKILDESYKDFIEFYSWQNGIELYAQGQTPELVFYPLNKCKTKNKLLKKWFLQFEQYRVNSIRSNGIAFGHIGDSGNVFVFENGIVKCYKFRDETVELGSLSEFLEALASNPIEVIKKLGSEVRFSGKGAQQWFPYEYKCG